jgi:hypothetical protein
MTQTKAVRKLKLIRSNFPVCSRCSRRGDVEEWGNLLPFNITFRLNQEVILLRRGKFSLLEYRYGGGGGGPPISLGLVLTAA